MTVDTNILIAYLDNDRAVTEALSVWKQEGRPLFLPSVVEVELLSFAGWTSAQRRTVEMFLEENFSFIPLDRTIARIAASIRRADKIKTPDAIIASTAIFTHTPLITKNAKDFERITALRVMTI